jgi:hypothetical protein
MAKACAGVIAASLLAVLIGCDSSRGGGAGLFASEPCLCRDMPMLNKGQVYRAALTEMQQAGPVSTCDPNTGVVVSEPQYLSRESGESAKQFRVISTPSDLRRLTRVTVSEEPGGARLLVCVAVQRRDTASVRQYQALRDPGDIPNDIPLREFSREMEHREVWTTISRDYQAEEALANAIASRFKQPPTSQPGM